MGEVKIDTDSAPEADSGSETDAAPDGFAAALARLGASVMANPWCAVPAATEFAANVVAAGASTAALALGHDAEPVLSPAPRDRRFSDKAWNENPWFFGTEQLYLAWAKFMREIARQGELDDSDGPKAEFAVDALVDALAPTNFLATNPVAMRKAVKTRGQSAVDGLRNLLDDVTDNRGRPRQVNRDTLEVGRDLAATQGKVVFRNGLMELIQYAPQTEKVFDVPLLLSPPWINKYYIMDLAPGRSFVEWAVQQGHTVFAISYRNPDESMRHVALDDYLVQGLQAALDAVSDITGSADVNVVGLCVGGTLGVMLSAYQAQAPEDQRRIKSLTLLNTLVDFSEPGALAVFTDAAAIELLEQKMAAKGYLDGRAMADTFDALRANDLIWNYVGTGWLMGEEPASFDILAWNSDPTNITEATHSSYLRACYLENQLAKSQMIVAGRRLRLDDIEGDAYVLAASEDHITPWKSSYATTGLLPTRTRFVLTSSGHIAGVVNPPSPKRRYWTNDDLPEDPDQWLEAATQHPGSWWEDWAGWVAARAGGKRNAPSQLGNAAHPPSIDAPGTYVKRETS